MIKSVAHVCFVVKDLDASISFYREKLGMKEAFDFINDEGERFGVYLQAGGRTFMELFKGAPAAASEGQSYRHTCLEVDDIQRAVADLRAAGVELDDPVLGSDGSWQAWLADPDGNRIELHQYTPESKQTKAIGGL